MSDGKNIPNAVPIARHAQLGIKDKLRQEGAKVTVNRAPSDDRFQHGSTPPQQPQPPPQHEHTADPRQGAPGQSEREPDTQRGQGSTPTTVYANALDGAAGAQPQGQRNPALPNGPVAGWLVVVEGPGVGNSREFYFDGNSIGRNPDQRVALAYGDNEISRDGHAYLLFDRRTNRSILESGKKRSPVYVNGEVLVGTRDLQLYDKITIGKTTLMFVPLCGLEFGWDFGSA